MGSPEEDKNDISVPQNRLEEGENDLTALEPAWGRRE